MTKANPLIEALGLQDMFYKESDVFFVKMPNNKMEKHYYLVNKDAEVQVFDSKNKKTDLKNPKIKGEGVCIDAKTKRNIYLWKWGSSFAIPAFSTEGMDKVIITDNDFDQIFDAGMAWEQMNSDPKNQEDGSKRLFMLLIGIGVLNIIIGALVFLMAQKQGIIDGLLTGAGL